MTELTWLIVLALLFGWVQSWLYRRFSLKKLDYMRSFAARSAFEGEEIEMVERIANRKLLPLPWLRLESLIPVGLKFGRQQNLDISGGELYQNHKSIFALPPFRKITRRHTVRCMKRGCYRLSSATMTAGDLFGASSVTKRLELAAELLVYPKIRPLGAFEFPSRSWMGDMAVRRWIVEDPFLVTGVREYRPGDSMRHINWKATARTGELQVHRNDYTADRRLMVLLNFDLSEEMWNAVTEPERIECGLSYAASLIHHAVHLGMEAGFGCNGYLSGEDKVSVRVSCAAGKEHLQAILETMARMEIARSLNFAAFLEEELCTCSGADAADYCIITAFVNAPMEAAIKRLQEKGHSVTVCELPLAAKEAAVQ